MGLCANIGLTIYDDNAVDVYIHSPISTKTYLAVDNTYAKQHSKKKTISKRILLQVRIVILTENAVFFFFKRQKNILNNSK